MLQSAKEVDTKEHSGKTSKRIEQVIKNASLGSTLVAKCKEEQARISARDDG